ncbi:MAG TPA: DUF192 domain-containing protein [Candidatus Pacearchaeota archaeon]|nr:DUF192 domain-containing protein [Candidatus Pacearchaeota archaeon]
MKNSKERDLIFYFRNKKSKIKLKRLNELEKGIGLMFKSRKTQNLLFEFENPTRIAIHSFFVFFPFAAIWLNEKNEFIEGKIVYPFNFYVAPQKSFYKLIEIPLDKSEENLPLSSIMERFKYK